MTTQYNIVTYGNLTNNNGVLSGFSSDNYATIPLNFNPTQRPYEVVFKFSGTNGVIWNVGDLTTPRGHVDFEIYQNKLYAEFSANTTLIWSIEGVTTLSSNTNYWAKLTYNGIDTYSLYLSTDGTTWNTEGTTTSSNFLSDGSTQYNLIGCQTDNGVITYSFDGSIDLNESYINIDNIRWWQGATTISNVRTKIQLRHDTAANWTSVNPILLEGEVGIETDTRKQKFGDGTTAWNSLPYDKGSTALQSITSSNVTTALGYVPVSESTLNDYLRYRADLTLSNITSMGTLITSEFNQVYDELATKISGITSSDVTTALGYTPVNKAGDTMTGSLNNRNTNVTKGTNPSSNQYWEWRNLDNNQNPAEWHTNRMGAFQTTLYPNGTVETQIKAFQNDPTVSTTADIKLAITSSGVKSCEFPNTTCCDGQWVNNSGQLASDVSLAIGNDQRLEYNISSYLPNDNYSYEVRFSIDAQTGSGSGAGLSISLIGKAYNNVDTWVRVCNMYARGSWTMVVGNSAIIPIGTDRKVKLNYTVISKAARLTGLYIEAYRRIGTNA